MSESLSDRYKRLSWEYEYFYCNIPEAESYLSKFTALYEGDPEKMLEMGLFYLRNNNIEKADSYLRDAYSFQIKNQGVALLYACYLIQASRNAEALVILNKLALDRYLED